MHFLDRITYCDENKHEAGKSEIEEKKNTYPASAKTPAMAQGSPAQEFLRINFV